MDDLEDAEAEANSQSTFQTPPIAVPPDLTDVSKYSAM
jgi:hypothetical protein